MARELLLSAYFLGVALLNNPALQIFSSIQDPSTETEATRADAEMRPAAHRGNGSPKEDGCLVEGQRCGRHAGGGHISHGQAFQGGEGVVARGRAAAG